MASSTIKKSFRQYTFNTTIDSEGCITVPAPANNIAGVFIIQPSNAIATKNTVSGSDHRLLILRGIWNGADSSYHMKALNEGTQVQGTAIYY